MDLKILIGDLCEVNAVNDRQGSVLAPDQLQIGFGELAHTLFYHQAEFLIGHSQVVELRIEEAVIDHAEGAVHK